MKQSEFSMDSQGDRSLWSSSIGFPMLIISNSRAHHGSFRMQTQPLLFGLRLAWAWGDWRPGCPAMWSCFLSVVHQAIIEKYESGHRNGYPMVRNSPRLSLLLCSTVSSDSSCLARAKSRDISNLFRCHGENMASLTNYHRKDMCGNNDHSNLANKVLSFL